MIISRSILVAENGIISFFLWLSNIPLCVCVCVHVCVCVCVCVCVHIHTYALSWWLGGKEFFCQCRRHVFNLWVGKIPWRRKWQLIPVFLSGKSHGQRRLLSYSPLGHKRVQHDLMTKKQQLIYIYVYVYIYIYISHIFFTHSSVDI